MKTRTFKIKNGEIIVKGEDKERQEVNLFVVEKENQILTFGNLATLCRSIPDLGNSIHTLYREDLTQPYTTAGGYTIRRSTLVQGTRKYNRGEEETK